MNKIEITINPNQLIKCEILYSNSNNNNPRNTLDKFTYIDEDSWMYFYFDYKMHRNIHRLPAVITTDELAWFKMDEPHNIHGPAKVDFSGEGEVGYYLNGFQYTKEDWEEKRKSI